MDEKGGSGKGGGENGGKAVTETNGAAARMEEGIEAALQRKQRRRQIRYTSRVSCVHPVLYLR